MNKNFPPLRLFNYMAAGEGWGRPAGIRTRDKLTQHAAAVQPAGTLRISLQGVRGFDMTFAAEALVAVVAGSRAAQPVCLIDVADVDQRDNISAAAQAMGVPVTVWHGGNVRILGPEPSIGRRAALAYALARKAVRAAEFAAANRITIANASAKFRQLWEGGYLLRDQDTAASGGTEFVYRRIG